MQELTNDERELVRFGLMLYGTMPTNRMFRVIQQVISNQRFWSKEKLTRLPIKPRSDEKGMSQLELSVRRMAAIFTKQEGCTTRWKDSIDRMWAAQPGNTRKPWRQQYKDDAEEGLRIVTLYAGFDQDTPWGVILDKLKEDGVVDLSHEYVDLCESL